MTTRRISAAARPTMMMMAVMMLMALAGATPIGAQVTTGTIVGTISDANGIVPRAAVTIREVSKGTADTYVTDDTGSYTAPFLTPGTYVVEVNVPGFKKWVRGGVILQVNQRARVDVALEVGGVEETTTVTAEAPLLRTDSSEVGTVIEERAIKELPLNGRNFAALVYLTPGITPGQAGENLSGASTFNPRGASNFNALGHQANANAWLIDGIDNNEYLVQHRDHRAVGGTGPGVQGAVRGLLGRVRARRRRRLGRDEVGKQHAARHGVRVHARRRVRRAQLFRAEGAAGRRHAAGRSQAAAQPAPVRRRGRRRRGHSRPLRRAQPDVLLRRLRGAEREARAGVRQHGADGPDAERRFQRFPRDQRRPHPDLRPVDDATEPEFQCEPARQRHQSPVPARPVSEQHHPAEPHPCRRPQHREHLSPAERPGQLRQLHVHGEPRGDRQRRLRPDRPPGLRQGFVLRQVQLGQVQARRAAGTGGVLSADAGRGRGTLRPRALRRRHPEHAAHHPRPGLQLLEDAVGQLRQRAARRVRPHVAVHVSVRLRHQRLRLARHSRHQRLRDHDRSPEHHRQRPDGYFRRARRSCP